MRKQVAERKQAHDDRNLASMLTPEQKREKARRKLKEDTTGQVRCIHSFIHRL